MPLDSNYPIFHFAAVPREPHITTLAYTVHSSDPQPTYTITRDRSQPKLYLPALHDALYPDILYGSVRSTPEIQPASPGAQNNEPKVLLPSEFKIDLFNPSSSVIVEFKHTTLRGNYWEFALPKNPFAFSTSHLQPESVHLVEAHMTRVTFRWRKEGGVLSRSQLRCYLVAPGNLPGASSKKGAGEPDIPIANFSGLGDKHGKGELTLYESNYRRLDFEDLKGLEVVLVMSAAVINDIWFTPTITTFNLSNSASANGRSRKPSNPPAIVTTPAPSPQPQPIHQSPNGYHPQSPSGYHAQSPNAHRPSNSPLQAQSPNQAMYPPQRTRAYSSPPHQAQSRPYPTPQQEKRAITDRSNEQKATQEHRIAQEQEQIRRMLAEEEARERQRKQAEVDRETERLKRQYEQERQQTMRRASVPPPRVPARPVVVGSGGPGASRVNYAPAPVPVPVQQPQRLGVPGQQPQQPQQQYFGGNGSLRPDTGKRLEGSRRKSFMGLSFGGGDSGKKGKLSKKQSSMF